jgi:hypothetical protein
VALQLLELGVVQDFVQLQRNQVVDLRDAGVIIWSASRAQRHRPFEHLGDEFLNQALSPLARARVGEPPLFNDLVEKTRFRGLFHRCRRGCSLF